MLINDKFFRILIYVITIIAVSKGLKNFNWAIYLFLLAFVLIIISSYHFINIKDFAVQFFLFSPFLVWALLTSFWALQPITTVLRAGYLCVVLIAVAVISMYSIKKPTFFYRILYSTNTIIIIVSLISLVIAYPKDAWTGGNGIGFMGFNTHQNTLGALILFTISGPLFFLLSPIKFENKIYDTKRDWTSNLAIIISKWHFLIIIINLIILALTYSRASILSFLILGALLGFLFNIKTILYMLAGFSLALIVLISFPEGKEYLKNAILKNEGEFGSNRYEMYKTSYNAALNGGIFGLGYGMSDQNIINRAVGSRYEGNVYKREKGNSQLALIEETGVIGGLFFLLPFVFVYGRISRFEKLFRKGNYNKDIFVFPSNGVYLELKFLRIIIISLIIHSFFEGWWTGTASPLLFFFLLYLSYAILLKLNAIAVPTP